MDTARRSASRARRDRRGITAADDLALDENRGKERATPPADARMVGATRGENSSSAEAKIDQVLSCTVSWFAVLGAHQCYMMRLWSAISNATGDNVLFGTLSGGSIENRGAEEAVFCSSHRDPQPLHLHLLSS